MIASTPRYLRPVFSTAHWRVWQVTDAPALATGPARLERLSPQSMTLMARTPGAVLVRVHYTPLWSVERGSGCVRQGPGGWTLVEPDRRGPIELEVSASPLRLLGSGAACDR